MTEKNSFTAEDFGAHTYVANYVAWKICSYGTKPVNPELAAIAKENMNLIAQENPLLREYGPNQMLQSTGNAQFRSLFANEDIFNAVLHMARNAKPSLPAAT